MSLLTKARALVLAFGLMAGVPLAAQIAGFKLLATPEYLRPDPFGGIVGPDYKVMALVEVERQKQLDAHENVK